MKRNLAKLKITVEVVCYSTDEQQKRCKHWSSCNIQGITQVCEFYQAGTCTNQTARKEAMKKYSES